MDLWMLLLLVAALGLAVLGIVYACYYIAFFNTKKKNADPDQIPLLDGKIYDPYREEMAEWVRWTRSLSCEEMEITSHDGLRLRGKYYEYAPGAPIELMFHGYRGNAERDLSGGVSRCFSVGRSVLMVDQRSCGNSEGNTITFGIYEHLDCLQWVEYAVSRFGPDCKIILTGVSMGASTVLMAAGKPLPKNVIGVLADCGFTSAKEIMYQVIRTLGLPPKLCYPFVKLGANLFGSFDLDSYSALEAVEHIQVPVIFYHGQTDDFVPCAMSEKMYAACKAKKRLVIVPGAGHGLAFPVDKEGYLQALKEFFGPEASAKK